jgi:integrase
LADEIADSEEVEIKKGVVFDTLEHLKYFLMDYAIRFHRPYYVTHFDKNKRYTVFCKNGYQWGLWAQRKRNKKWKIRNARQPHTCRSSKPKGVHAQNTAHYLGHRLVGTVRAYSDTSVSSMIETIFGFTLVIESTTQRHSGQSNML